jgi:competence protein ComEC
MTKYISNHPFIFLISLVVMASVLLGGMLIIFSFSNPGPLPVASLITETARSKRLAEFTPSETASIEIPATSLPKLSETFTVTTGLDATLTSTPVIPTATSIRTLSTPGKPLVITFIDVGQGDSILIVSPEGLTMLIDGGSSDNGVVAYLRGQGVSRIDIMVATHPHEDHIGGLIQVLEAIPVARVVTNGQSHTTATYEHFLDAILNSGAEYFEVRRGDTITLGDLKILVMNPGISLADELNENSIVLQLIYGETTFLFMGDAGFDAEGRMLAAGLHLKADVLKVGHHGSCSATSQSFLRAVQPEVGIYSAGFNNQYGHPCLGTIDSLTQYGVLVLGTDVYGSIIFNVTQDGYQITDSTGKEIRK